MTTRIAVVSAGLSNPSSTRLLADRLADAAARALQPEQVRIDRIELRDLAHSLTDAALTGFATGRLREVLEQLRATDAVIAVTPTFNAGYSGLFKMFFDVLDSDTLRGAPVLLGATGGSERHSLVIEHGMRPLFSYLGALTMPTGVYAATSDWASGARALGTRIDRAGTELAQQIHGTARAEANRAQRSGSDGFDNVVPFEQLLAGA